MSAYELTGAIWAAFWIAGWVLTRVQVASAYRGVQAPKKVLQKRKKRAYPKG